MKRDVFISYSRKNYDAVMEIKRQIDAATDADCWIDLNAIESGTERFTKDIVEGVDNCKVLLFMLSEESQQSEYALLELNYAKKIGKRIVLVNVDGCEMKGTFLFKYSLTDTILWSNKLQREKLLRDVSRWILSEAMKDVEKRDSNQWEEDKKEWEKRECHNGKRLLRKKWWWAIGGIVVVIVGVIIFFVGRTKIYLDGNNDLVWIIRGVQSRMRMVYVAGGTFTEGVISEQKENPSGDEKLTNRVTLGDFYIGETEVTQSLWKAVMGTNPSCSRGDNLPVEMVTRDDAQKFIDKLNKISDCYFRLPTEAEWEYAARGGNNSSGYKYSGGDGIDSVAWYQRNSDRKTHPVGKKRANELGLYDMSGNVQEWCRRNHDSASQTIYVSRGGSWRDEGRNCCVIANRNYIGPPFRDINIGFRLAMSRKFDTTSLSGYK